MRCELGNTSAKILLQVRGAVNRFERKRSGKRPRFGDMRQIQVQGAAAEFIETSNPVSP